MKALRDLLQRHRQAPKRDDLDEARHRDRELFERVRSLDAQAAVIRRPRRNDPHR